MKSVVIALRAFLHSKNASFPVASRFTLRTRFVLLLSIIILTVVDFCVCFFSYNISRSRRRCLSCAGSVYRVSMSPSMEYGALMDY